MVVVPSCLEYRLTCGVKGRRNYELVQSIHDIAPYNKHLGETSTELALTFAKKFATGRILVGAMENKFTRTECRRHSLRPWSRGQEVTVQQIKGCASAVRCMLVALSSIIELVAK